MVSRFDPAGDKQFEDLARLLGVRRRQRVAKPGEEWPWEEIDPNDIFFQEQFRGGGAGYGPGPAFNPEETFHVSFTDVGAGVANVTPIRGPAATFARTSTAYAVLSTGDVASVAADSPRSHYAPNSVTSRNYLLWSDTFSAANWTDGAGTQAGKDIRNVRDVYLPTTSDVLAQQFTAVAGQSYAWSAIIHADSTCRRVALYIVWNGAPFGNDRSIVTFNLDTLTVEATNAVGGALPTVSLTDLGGNRYQIKAVATTTIGGTSTIVLRDSVTAAGAKRFIRCDGVQLDKASSAGAYVSTGAAAAGNGTYLGFYSEGQRTNICLQSEDLATTWVNTRSTETTNAILAPDGTQTADKLVEDATAANTHQIQQSFVKAASAIQYTISLWAKAGERTWIALQGNDGTNAATAYFNLGTGVVGSTAQNGAYTADRSTIQTYPNGWYRLTFTYTTPTTVADAFIIYIAEGDNDVTYNGDGASGLYVWGMQKEVAGFASSYIPTTTVSVTRAADVLTYPAGIMNAGIGTPGTWFLQCQTVDVADTLRKVVMGDNAGGNTRWEVRADTDLGTNCEIAYGATTGAVVGVVAGAATANTNLKIAASHGPAGVAAVLNGGAVGTNATPSNLNWPAASIGIGCIGSGGSHLYGAVLVARYYRQQFSNTALQAMTA